LLFVSFIKLNLTGSLYATFAGISLCIPGIQLGIVLTKRTASSPHPPPMSLKISTSVIEPSFLIKKTQYYQALNIILFCYFRIFTREMRHFFVPLQKFLLQLVQLLYLYILKHSESDNEVNLKIFSTDGRLLMQQFMPNNASLRIDVKALPSNKYYLMNIEIEGSKLHSNKFLKL